MELLPSLPFVGAMTTLNGEPDGRTLRELPPLVEVMTTGGDSVVLGCQLLLLPLVGAMTTGPHGSPPGPPTCCCYPS